MRRTHPRLFGYFWDAFVFIFVAFPFAAAFFVTGYVYKITHVSPPIFLAQMINSFLGLLLTSFTMTAFSHFFRRREFDGITPIIQAMEGSPKEILASV